MSDAPQLSTDAVPVLEALQLSAGYGRIPVIRELNLQVHAGEVVAIVGPNGAGKTTALEG
jgi:branched-chain amino acid transport system ATP-binding protein